MDAAEKCSSCSGPLPKTFDRTCPRCGWDNQVGVRKCLSCKAIVSIHEAIGYGPITGGVGILGLVFWRFFGLGIGGSIVLAIGALCGLITALTLSYKCGGCGKRAPGRVRSSAEKRSVLLRRVAYLAGSVLLGVGAVLLLVMVAASL
jgi:hypothetical protein